MNIPKNAHIISARLKFVSWATIDITKVKLKIYGIDEDDTETFLSDPFGRAHTSAAVDWDPETWPGHEYPWPPPPDAPGEDDWVLTPELKAIVAEVVSREGWELGNAIGFFIEDDGSSHPEGDAEIYTYDFGAPFGPILEVGWVEAAWLLQMDVECLYGLIGLKMLCGYDSDNKSQYETMMEKAVSFLREGFENLWLYYDPPPSGDGKWHRAPGVPPENLIYDDSYSYALHALYLYEGWSETVEKVFRYCSEISPSIDYPAYQPAICWPGYLDIVNRKPHCEYYDAVTSGILALQLRKNHDGISYEYAKKIIQLHSDAFMYWGPKFTDYTPVENKKSVVTVSWLGLYLLDYSPIINKFTQILNAYGEIVTFYPVIPGKTESYAEGIIIKAIVNSTRSAEILLEPGYVIDDYVTVYAFAPLKHHDKLVHKSIPYVVIGVQDYRFQNDVMYVKASCRRLIT